MPSGSNTNTPLALGYVTHIKNFLFFSFFLLDYLAASLAEELSC